MFSLGKTSRRVPDRCGGWRLLVLSALCVIAILGSVSACATSSAPAAKPAAPVTVRLGWAGIPTLPFDAAVYQRNFEEQGITIERSDFKGSSPIIEAATANNIDLGLGGVSTAVLAYGAGAKVRTIASVNYAFKGKTKDWTGVWLVTRADDKITSIEGLKGKTIAVNALGSNWNLYLRNKLQQKGIDPDKDVKIVAIGHPEMPGAMVGKQVDAAIVDRPGYIVAQEKLKLNVLGTQNDLTGVPVSSGATVVASNKFADENPAAVVRFMKAYVKGANFVIKDLKENNGQKVRAIVKQYYPDMGKDQAKIEAFMEQVSDAYIEELGIKPGQVVVAHFTFEADLLFKAGTLKKAFNAQEAIDHSYLKRAYDELELKWELNDYTKGATVRDLK